jgi:hypothetical protein
MTSVVEYELGVSGLLAIFMIFPAQVFLGICLLYETRVNCSTPRISIFSATCKFVPAIVNYISHSVPCVRISTALHIDHTPLLKAAMEKSQFSSNG